MPSPIKKYLSALWLAITEVREEERKAKKLYLETD